MISQSPVSYEERSATCDDDRARPTRTAGRIAGGLKRTTMHVSPSGYYPDSGSPYEDRAILRNAVQFATAQRAYAAQLLLERPLEDLAWDELSFLVVEAFSQFVTSTEDTLGSLFALSEWRPGTVEGPLLAWLDRVQVGRGKHSEERDHKLLLEVDGDRFRRLTHMPPALGWCDQVGLLAWLSRLTGCCHARTRPAG